MRKQLFISVCIFFFLISGTVLVILYGMGNRLGFSNGRPTVSKTGILGVTSTPDAAQIYINDHLTTATNSNINLTPGEYDIKITKDGYFPYQKKVKIEEQIATKVDALLFPLNPKLEGIATSGVEAPVLDPSGTRIAFRISTQTPRKNGIYILDMGTRPLLTLQSSSTQIADDTIAQFSKATYTWSPDGKDLLASISGTLKAKTPTYYLLKTNTLNEAPQDITAVLATTQQQWIIDKTEKERARMLGLRPRAMQQLITDNFAILAWSPDETKILYSASQSAQLPLIITPRLFGINTLHEERAIKKDAIYVYDTKEDTNNKLFDSLPTTCNTGTEEPCHSSLSWFPDSEHLIYINDKRIAIMEYDSSNNTTIYAGPFIDNYAFPWPNSSKIVILTNLNNPQIPPTLYTISLK